LQRAVLTAFVRSVWLSAWLSVWLSAGLLGWSSAAFALCKYQAADGSWTYANSCAPMPEKVIDQSATQVVKKNAAGKKIDSGIDARRLRGYEYSTTTHSGTRIRMVEPNKGRPAPEFTTQ